MLALPVKLTLESLKKLFQPKSKGKRRQDLAGETLGCVASYLVFLNGSLLSPDAEGKLSEVFRRQLPVLYTASPYPALEFTAALCKTIYEEKIIKSLTSGDNTEKLRWECVLNALLSGVLDYLDENQDDDCKETIGSVLYPALCSTFFSSSISHTSVDLRCTGYSVLSESADCHRANQKRLLNQDMLGGVRLGSMLWRTKDYLVMESILNLFARMIPPSGSTASGRAQRRAFIRSVFVDSSPDDAKTGEELANMVEHVSTPDWEQTSSQIVDTLANSNIGYPQPFSISEIVAGGEAKPSDRLFVDEQGFLANVLIEDDLFDSLTAPYSAVTSVDISHRSGRRQTHERSPTARVSVTLSTSPEVGHKPIEVHSPALSPQLAFTLASDDIGRLQAALKSRGLDHLVALDTSTKQSILVSPATLEIDFAGNLIGKDEMGHRIRNLSQLYGTNDASDDQDEANSAQFTGAVLEEAPCIDPALLMIRSQTADDSSSKAQPDVVPANFSVTVDTSAIIPALGVLPWSPDVSAVKPATASMRTPVSASRAATLAPPMTPVRRTASQVLRETAFGTSDDELSSVESLLDPPKASRNPAPKPAVQAVPGKIASAAKVTKGRRVLDSDDETLASKPTKLPPKQAGKKALDISDDEIEDVLPATRSLVLSRSVLPMTPMTPSKTSSSRRQSIISKAASLKKNSCSASGKLSAAAKDRSADLKAPTCVDVDLDPSDGELVNLKTEPASAAILGDLGKANAPIQPDSAKATKQVRMSSPPVQPVQKSVKSALRKKNQPALESAKSEKTKRKRAAEDEAIKDDSDPAAPKRAKLDPAKTTFAVPPAEPKDDTHVFKQDSGRAKKQYRAKKARASSPPSPAPHIIDFDKIPDPIASVPKSDRTCASKTSKKASKDSTKELPAAARVTRSRVTKGKENAAVHQGASAKSSIDEVARAIPQESEEEVKGRAETKRKSVRKKVEEAKPESDIEVEEKSKKESSNKEDVTPIVQSEVPTTDHNHVSPVMKSKKAPWEDLHVKEIELASASDPAPVEVDVPGSPRPSEADFVFNALEDVKPVIDLDDFTAEVTLVASSPTKMPDAKVNVQPIELERKIVDDDVVHTVQESPMRFAAPSPTPPAVDVRYDSRKRISHDAPKTPRAKMATTFDVPGLPTRVASSVMKPTSKPFPPILKDQKLSFVASPKPASAAIQSGNSRVPGQSKRLQHTDVTDDIATVLQEITEALLHRITNKAEGVRHDILRGRDMILNEAAADLVDMRADSIDRYNHLIELEAEYASFGRSLIHGLDDLTTANRNIHSEIEKIIATHNRSSVVKQVPSSLFASKLPSSIKRFMS